MSDPEPATPASPPRMEERPRPAEVADPQPLQVLEETARIDKEIVETGRVRVQTQTEVVEQLLHESLKSEAVEVTCVSINRTLLTGEAPPQTRTDGDLTIIPVLEEVLFVEKRLVLKEELHIRRHTSVEDVSVPVSLRKQRAVIDRVEAQTHSQAEDSTS